MVGAEEVNIRAHEKDNGTGKSLVLAEEIHDWASRVAIKASAVFDVANHIGLEAEEVLDGAAQVVDEALIVDFVIAEVDNGASNDIVRSSVVGFVADGILLVVLGIQDLMKVSCLEELGKLSPSMSYS